ncbi:MAG: hypothetical protein ACREDR_29480, partial [Blastocatellia bacterium]
MKKYFLSLARLVLALAGIGQLQDIAAQTGPTGTQQPAPAQADAQSPDELRKEAQNPVASLISVPIQNNNNFGIGPDNRTQ